MMRLFKEGLGKELVNSGEDSTAYTRFIKLPIHSKFRIWRPFSESEYNQMLATLKGAGLLSVRTGIELNTVSAPDEVARVTTEAEENFQTEMKHTEEKKKLDSKYSSGKNITNNKTE